jgi:glycosyltransferase involved in cell wall biosynthesis
VLPYVERLAGRDVTVHLHSFEQKAAPAAVVDRLRVAGVRWQPHAFGPSSAAGGALRVVRGAAAIRGADLVHARGDQAAGSALLAGRRRWVWDVRSFWREERIDQGLIRPGSPTDRALQQVETRAARRSSAVVTLSARAIDVLTDRFGPAVRAKASVVTTCLDLDRFSLTPFPSQSVIRLLMLGSFNDLYDVTGMVRCFEQLRQRRATELTVLTSRPGPWTAPAEAAGAAVVRAAPDDVEAVVASHHVGLCLYRTDVGVCRAAAMPIKVGEHLAAGRPVVVSRGLGDLPELVTEYDCGVVVDDLADGWEAALDEVERLLADDGTPARCRALAEAHFDLERGVDALVVAYRRAMAAE